MAQNVIINGIVYSEVPYVEIPHSNSEGHADFYDTSDANATDANVLSGKTYYADGKQTGSMANNGDTSGDISTKDGTVNIPAGFTSGGTVGLASSAKSAIVSGNIKSGVSILGVNGSSSVVDTAVSSGEAASAGTIVSGKKAYVNGSLVEGSATLPTISQDATSKVLSIS